jgi:molybdopterin-guanine dinucleotide biosynthesis protein A
MENKKLYTGIVLAGGKGIRLGTDKGLIELNGRKLIEYAIEILSPFCNEIIISSNNPEYRMFLFRIIPDLTAGKGPMMGIYSSLKASPTTANLILAVDNIFVTRAFFRYLLSMNLSAYHVAVPYVQNEYFEPLVGYYSTKCITVMEQMMQEHNYKLPDLFSKIPVNKLLVEGDFPDFKQNYFQSLNNPEDLAMLKGLHPCRP